MGRENPQELGARQEIVQRYGPSVPILGMRRRGRDAGAIAFPQWQYLLNVRFNDGIGNRPAHDIFLDGLPGDVVSLFDFQNSRARGKLFIIYAGCPGVDPASGQSLNWYDHEQETELSRGIYYTSAVFEACLAVHDGKLYIGTDETLRGFISVIPDYEDEALFISGLDQTELLKTFTGYTVRAMISDNGELFIGLENKAVPAASKVVRWDGVTFRDDVTGVDPPSCLRGFRNNSIAMTFSSAAGGLHVRNSAGVWANVAGALGNVQCVMEEYRDNLYITEDGADLWKYDGAALAIVHSIATARIDGLANAFGYLYYGHNRSAATTDASIGRLDSTGTYIDLHKNLATQANPTPPPTDFSFTNLVKRLSFYRGALIAGVESTTWGGRLFLSRAADVSGTWDIVTPIDVFAPGFGGIVAFQVL